MTYNIVVSILPLPWVLDAASSSRLPKVTRACCKYTYKPNIQSKMADFVGEQKEVSQIHIKGFTREW